MLDPLPVDDAGYPHIDVFLSILCLEQIGCGEYAVFIPKDRTYDPHHRHTDPIIGRLLRGNDLLRGIFHILRNLFKIGHPVTPRLLLAELKDRFGRNQCL